MLSQAHDSMGVSVVYKIYKTSDSILCTASVAQWLEHWSCKPGVASSILAGGYFDLYFYSVNVTLGKIRDIGAYKFSTEQLEYLLRRCAVIPAMLQAEFHPYLYRKSLVDICRYNSIRMQGFCFIKVCYNPSQTILLVILVLLADEFCDRAIDYC